MASENVEIVRALAAAWERGDDEYQLAHMDPDIVLTEWPDSPDPRTYHGTEGVRQAVASWAEAWEWLKTDVRELVDAGDRVIVCGTTRGKGRGSAVEVTIDTFNVYTLRGGRVTRLELFTSEEDALRAAGLRETDNVELVHRFAGAFNRGDVDALLARCDPEVELSEWPAAVGARTYHGHEGVRAAIDSWFESWESMQLEIEDIQDLGDRMLVTFHQRAKGRGSRVEVEVTSYNVFTFRDGRTVRIQLFTERELALEAAGIPIYEEETR